MRWMGGTGDGGQHTFYQDCFEWANHIAQREHLILTYKLNTEVDKYTYFSIMFFLWPLIETT